MGFRKYTGLLLLIILTIRVSQAQTLAGQWLGVTYPGDPNQAAFTYLMTLAQTGNTLSGTTQSVNPASGFSGTVRLSGQLNGSTLQFNESDQTGNTAVPGICFWQGTMVYNPSDESLIGTYENIVNNTCTDVVSGKIELYRMALKSGSTFCKGSPINLEITGKNRLIKWYSSAAKTTLLATGNTYSPNITQTTTFYVTQTLYQIESPAIPFIITVAEPVFKAAPVSTGCDKTNGSIDVTASGTAGWQYSINGGTFQTNSLFTSLTPGSYTITAKDTYGCQASQTVSISNETAPTISNLKTTSPQCASANGEVSVLAQGGKAPLTYSIDYGVTFQSSSVFTNLAGGSYTIRVRDMNGCEVNRAVSLTPFAPMEIRNVQVVPTSCGQPNGQVTLSISGGRNPVQYTVDAQSFQASSQFTSLQAGTYTVQAKDSTNCTISQSVSIAASSGPQIADIETTNAACGEQNGTIHILTTTPTPNVSYSIDGQSFQRSPLFTGLKAGAYTLTSQDDTQCTVTQPVQISLDCTNHIYLPTAFSPNHDSLNDTFTLYFGFSAITITNFIVYDRWGAVVYNRANFTLSSGESLWDGQLNGQTVPAGMYGFRLDCFFPDGTPMTYRQSVSLLY